MISINSLFVRLNEDLVQKGLGGFARNDTFQRAVNEAQDSLMEYYFDKFRISQKVNDAVLPFQVYSNQQVTSGVFQMPDDYRHLLAMSYLTVTNTTGEPVVSEQVLREKSPNEERRGFRRPTVGNPLTYAYELSADGNFLYPSSLTGRVRVKYLKSPVRAVRAVTLNPTTDDEDYNPTGSVDLDWPESQLTNFIDLLMYFKGAEVRDNDLGAWVAGKRQLQASTNR